MALDGYDEISLTGSFKLFTQDWREVINPEDIGQTRLIQSDIYGGNSVRSSRKFLKIS